MRGQAQTLEGIAAAILIIAAVSFALQATAVTPLSASTSNQHVENQLQDTATSLLIAAQENETLRSSLVAWNSSANGFNGSSEEGYFVQWGPRNAFGDALNNTFIENRVATNIVIWHMNENGSRTTQRLMFMGQPSDNAVSTTGTVILYDNSSVQGSYQNVSEAAANDAFYAPDAAPDSELFNVMEVEITVWRI